MSNLEIYDKVRTVPKEAQKQITAGRLKGKTDINPMWRIKKLTEIFGPVGVGWYYEIDSKWLEIGADGEIAANVEISLYIKHDGEWSKPIKGLGGAQFVAKEKGGFYTDDDCYKKALTDAISVSCKALGVGGDIYWERDPSKYDKPPQQSGNSTTGGNNKQGDAAQQSPQANTIDKEQIVNLIELATIKGVEVSLIEQGYGKNIEQLTIDEYEKSMASLRKR